MTSSFPNNSGVYFFKDAHDMIIYIGKAVCLRDRLRTYFQKGTTDWKVSSLMSEYATIDWIITSSEAEALLLEAELIKKHQPKYNVLLKSGQPFIYIVRTNQPIPELQLVRNKKVKGTYFGPFIHKIQARKVYAFLMQTFRLTLCSTKIANGCLNYHLGNCAGNCKTDFDLNDYLFRLDLAMAALGNRQDEFRQKIEDQIKVYAKQLAFEKAKRLYGYLTDIDTIFHFINVKYSDQKFAHDLIRVTAPAALKRDLSQAGTQIKEFLGVDTEIRTIDCFDISHFQGRSIVGSCVRFTDGHPDKNKFRRFKIQSLVDQNDYAALAEIVARRYKEGTDLPDLIMIDGGKGQLNAVKHLYPQALFISLAKREERIFWSDNPEGKQLDIHTQAGAVLIALRDYTHHFAITYHRQRRSKEI